MVKGVFFLVTNLCLYLNTLTLPNPSRFCRDVKEHAAFGDDDRAANIVSGENAISLSVRACFYTKTQSKLESSMGNSNESPRICCVCCYHSIFIGLFFQKKKCLKSTSNSLPRFLLSLKRKLSFDVTHTTPKSLARAREQIEKK